MSQTGSAHSEDNSDRTRQFLLLLSQHDRSLYAYILALVPNVAEVQDIAQDVRLRLWEQFDKFEPGTDFGAWSRTIAHYLILAHRKRSSRRHAQFSEAFLECVAAEVSGTVGELPDRQTALQVCLEKLSDKARDLLVRYYAGKQTAKQVAEEVGQSAAAVRQAISRSRRELGQCIETEIRREVGS